MGLALRQFDEIVLPFPAQLKHCPRCDESLPLSEFGVCRARKDGLNLYCKRCIRQKITLQRQASREYRKRRLAQISASRPSHSVASHRALTGDIGYRLKRNLAKLLRQGSPADRVREAIRRGHHTQKEIALATKLSRDEICDALASLLLWTKEVRTQMVRHQRMYFINEAVEELAKAQNAKKKPLSPTFSSIGYLMPDRPAKHRRKTA